MADAQRYRSAEDVRRDNIAAMGDKLGAIYSALCGDLIWLHFRWRDYRHLFATNSERLDLLNQVANVFAHGLQESLWDITLMGISRITDKAETFRKSNLTIQQLPKLIHDDELTARVQRFIHEAVTKTEFAKDRRNRRIAHADLDLALKRGAEPLLPASRQNVEDALSSIGDVLNELEIHYHNSTIYFIGISVPGDAESLLHVLREGVNAENARRIRFAEGKLTADDLEADQPI